MRDRRAEIAYNLELVEARISKAAIESERKREDITLIVVTKTFPSSDVAILKDLGICDFAENQGSEGSIKALEVSGRWHFQGQIQSNKLKSITQWASVIHSLDSLRHIEAIKKVMVHDLEIFIQVSLDSAQGRGGAEPRDLNSLADLLLQSKGLSLKGLMAVAPLGMEPRKAYGELALIYKAFRTDYPMAQFLSAGMSGDFESAIRAGATHVRIGSSILGSRNFEG